MLIVAELDRTVQYMAGQDGPHCRLATGPPARPEDQLDGTEHLWWKGKGPAFMADPCRTCPRRATVERPGSHSSHIILQDPEQQTTLLAK